MTSKPATFWSPLTGRRAFPLARESSCIEPSCVACGAKHDLLCLIKAGSDLCSLAGGK